MGGVVLVFVIAPSCSTDRGAVGRLGDRRLRAAGARRRCRSARIGGDRVGGVGGDDGEAQPMSDVGRWGCRSGRRARDLRAATPWRRTLPGVGEADVRAGPGAVAGTLKRQPTAASALAWWPRCWRDRRHRHRWMVGDEDVAAAQTVASRCAASTTLATMLAVRQRGRVDRRGRGGRRGTRTAGAEHPCAVVGGDDLAASRAVVDDVVGAPARHRRRASARRRRPGRRPRRRAAVPFQVRSSAPVTGDGRLGVTEVHPRRLQGEPAGVVIAAVVGGRAVAVDAGGSERAAVQTAGGTRTPPGHRAPFELLLQDARLLPPSVPMKIMPCVGLGRRRAVWKARSHPLTTMLTPDT